MAAWQSDTLGTPPFSVFEPAEQRVPFVFNAPHSGRIYPKTFLDVSPLTDLQIRRSEDVLVDALFDDVVALGCPFQIAHFPRAWLDVNREPYELDPKLFREKLPTHANTRSMRVAGGLGTVPRLVAENLPIYRSRPKLAEAMARIDDVYRPYHETLTHLMAKTVVEFGYGVLVDCHSMPSTGGGIERADRPDIIIGDRYGTSCNSAISRQLVQSFATLGYKTTRNKPYAGGFITEHYGKPLKSLHAVQIEINRALYVDEETLRPHAGYDRLKKDISAVMSALVSMPDAPLLSNAIAAE
ncbi:MAG: N-formylglutamate amidohydrolase [Pseudomonadota bacterium]